MSFLKKLLGGGGEPAAAAAPITAKKTEYKGVAIEAQPYKEGAQYHLAGVIRKEIGGTMNDSDFHAMADSLLSGRYNLLVGAGASLDSINRHDANLLSGSAYLKFLSEKKKLAPKYSL